MTNLDRLFDALWATTVGFDPMFTNASRPVAAFPFYDIIKNDNDHYSVEIALAGYGPDDVEITWLPGALTINSVHKSPEEDSSRVYRGIAKRSFKLSFPLAQYVEVGKTQFENGLLRVDLVRNVPETAKPRKIAIGFDNQQLTHEPANVLQMKQKTG
jgi:molecular chaperone IbpA